MQALKVHENLKKMKELYEEHNEYIVHKKVEANFYSSKYSFFLRKG